MKNDRLGICLVASELAPVTPGGIGRVVRAILEGLNPDRFEAHLLFEGTRRECRMVRRVLSVELPHVQVWSVGDLQDLPIPIDCYRSEAYWRSHRIWRALETLAQRTRLDVVEFPDYNGPGYVSIKAKRQGLRSALQAALIVRLHGTGELAAAADGRWVSSPGNLQMAQCERYAVAYADRLLSPSPEVTQWMGEKYTLPPPDRIIVRAPPCSRPVSAIARRIFRTGDSLELLFVGKIQPLKGIFELVEVVRRLLEERGKDSIRLHIVGRDETEGGLGKNLPHRFKSAFQIHGELDDAKIAEIASVCHAAVFPSRMETFCLAAHELNALGLPLLLSCIPAFRAYFRDGIDAFLFQNGERSQGGVVSLLDLLRKICDEPKYLETLRCNSAAIGYETPREYENTVRDLVVQRAGIETNQVEGSISEVHPRISFVIPYFEMQEYIDETLASVEASEGVSWEAIVVDDGSQSLEAQKKFDDLKANRALDSRYVFLRKENGGLGSARNSGIAVARGEYVLPLDADDLVERSYAAIGVSVLDRIPELGFVSCIAHYFEDSTSPEAFREWFVPYDPFPPLLYLENGVGTASCVFRRRMLMERPYDETLPSYEDWDLQLGLSGQGVRGEVIPLVLFQYRFRRDSMVHSTAHPRHSELLSRMMAKRQHRDLSTWIQAMAVYVEKWNNGPEPGGMPAGISPGSRRAVLFSGARTLYRRWLLPFSSRYLSGAQQARMIRGAKRLLIGRLR